MRRGSAAVARRYADALLALALEKGQAEPVRDDLRGASAALAAHEGLRRALTHPALAAERRRALAAEVFTGRGRTELVPRLLALLAERGRVGDLPAIEEAFVDAWNERRGVVSVEAASASDLDAGQRDALSRALGQVTGKPVELRVRTEPELLGGVRLTLAGQVFDGSVRARLRALRKRLAGSA